MPDFTAITESPNQKATAEQLARIGQRYWFVRDYNNGQRILEVACGTGIGLNYLAYNEHSYVIGGDLDAGNLAVARKIVTPEQQISLVRFDAQALPFSHTSFDTVVCFEALYYFPDADQFFAEVVRVLKSDGIMVLCLVNRAWKDFHPSPYAHRNFNNLELFQLLSSHFGNIEIYGGFPTQNQGIRAKVISLVKRIAMAGHLIPDSLAARAYLKRIFFGPMLPIPTQVTEAIVPDERPVPIRPDRVNTEFKILYAVCG